MVTGPSFVRDSPDFMDTSPLGYWALVIFQQFPATQNSRENGG